MSNRQQCQFSYKNINSVPNNEAKQLTYPQYITVLLWCSCSEVTFFYCLLYWIKYFNTSSFHQFATEKLLKIINDHVSFLLDIFIKQVINYNQWQVILTLWAQSILDFQADLGIRQTIIFVKTK